MRFAGRGGEVYKSGAKSRGSASLSRVHQLIRTIAGQPERESILDKRITLAERLSGVERRLVSEG